MYIDFPELSNDKFEMNINMENSYYQPDWIIEL